MPNAHNQDVAYTHLFSIFPTIYILLRSIKGLISLIVSIHNFLVSIRFLNLLNVKLRVNT